MDASFFADQIGTTNRYAVARVRFGIKKWFAHRDDGTKVWGDPHVSPNDGTTVFDFDHDTAFLLGAGMAIADAE